ncbi:MAG: hypothetical protein ACOH2M_03315 [Cypionkella sp.]
MSKPADIPQDVWETAGDFETSLALSADMSGMDQLIIRESIARAILEEREACAARAEALDRSGREWVSDSLWAHIKADTASAIRAPTTGA